MMRVLAVTVGRSDFGIYLPVFRAIEASSELSLSLLVSGMHMCPEFGLTKTAVDAAGFHVESYEEILLSADTACGISKSMGIGIQSFATVYARSAPDLILVLGDRFEMFAAVAAAVPFQIPIAHLHGGELTEGAIDDVFRHSITKMSHVHLVATEEYARRVRQLGEEPERVHVVGAPGLDNLSGFLPLTRAEFQSQHGFTLPPEFLIATFHPVTTEADQAGEQVKAFLDGVESVGIPCVITMANADTSGRLVNSIIESRANHLLIPVQNLGTQGYFSAMSMALAMVGNSSSGIIEASSFGLPVVNIGSRQNGRTQASNVVNVVCEKHAISQALTQAITPEFRASLKGMKNPYGDGQASSRIVSVLQSLEMPKLLQKRFVDLTHLS